MPARRRTRFPAPAIATSTSSARPTNIRWSPYRAYTPPQATVAQLKALRTRIGISRNVIVQPSFYGIDNSCMLDAMAELGPSARGIAVVAPNTPLQTLRELDAKGVRGVARQSRIGGQSRSQGRRRVAPAICEARPAAELAHPDLRGGVGDRTDRRPDRRSQGAGRRRSFRPARGGRRIWRSAASAGCSIS